MEWMGYMVWFLMGGALYLLGYWDGRRKERERSYQYALKMQQDAMRQRIYGSWS